MAKLLSGTRIYGSANVDTTLTVGGAIYADKIVTTLPLVLNDVTSQTNSLTSVFRLRTEQADVTSSMITDSKNLEVIINNNRLAPYVKELRYPWLTPYDSFKGFRVVANTTQASIIIYNAPDIGEQVTLTIINSSLAAQAKRYPFSATTIALGD